MNKNNEDFYFTTRLGVILLIVLTLLVFLGDIAQQKTELIRPEFRVIKVEAKEPKVRNVTEEIEFVFGEQAELAKRVAFCESSLIPYKESNVSSAKGLFQIINGTWKGFKCSGNPLVYQDNIKCAKKIYDHYDSFGTSGGWLESKNCWK